MIYSSEFFNTIFDGKSDGEIFRISPDDFSKIRKLKSYRSDESGYYSTMLQWRYSDNMDIVSSPEELSRLFVCMQFITMIGKMNDNFISKYNVKEYHSNLVKLVYLEFYDGGDNCVTMGFKRPFGNSYVAGDIADEIRRCGIDGAYDEESDEVEEEFCEIALQEFINILDNFMKEFEMGFCSFKRLVSEDLSNRRSFDRNTENWIKHGINPLHWNLRQSWAIDPSEVRDIKINNVLECI
jgi:hypothetical protein